MVTYDALVSAANEVGEWCEETCPKPNHIFCEQKGE